MRKTAQKWPNWLNDIWAKSPLDENDTGEGLAAHTWLVLGRLRELASLRPWLERDHFPLWHILFWACFIHDWGKAAPGFQAVLRGGAKWPHRHEVLSLAFLSWMPSLNDVELLGITTAIAAHHKDPYELRQLYPPNFPEQLNSLVKSVDSETLHNLYKWLTVSAPVWLQELDFTDFGVKMIDVEEEDKAIDLFLSQGAATIQARLAEYWQLTRSIEDSKTDGWLLRGIFLRGYFITSDYMASAHVSSILPLTIKDSRILEACGLRRKTLFEHQIKAAYAKGSTILTSPTGSGKTESALLWAASQSKISKLFYVLPYQASMNAMYDRLISIFPNEVGLLHSRSVLAMYQRFMRVENDIHNAVRRAKRHRNLAFLHHQPVQIFSPYQMLKAAFRLKGYEALLSDFAYGAFVIDEIHAYEPARLAMILEFIRFLRERFNANFFVMSATLPSIIKKHIQSALGTPHEIQASGPIFRQFARHQVYVEKGQILKSETLRKIGQKFQAGASILVVCNTVARAQEVYDHLRRQFAIPEKSIILIHGRLNGHDRLEKENKVIKATGLNSKDQRPVIVVSTQVVEVSLNIDLDILFSDPAPLEALVQRFGRVNRKKRVETAPCFVFEEPTGKTETIYNPTLVSKTLNVLKESALNRPLDENDIQGWLDKIYTGSALDEWQEKYQKAAAEFNEAFINTIRPFSSDTLLETKFNQLFDGVEVLPLSLLKKHEIFSKERPLEASQLLVPITWGQWMRLNKAGLVFSDASEWPPVVDVPYSPELGLQLDQHFGSNDFSANN